MSFRASKRLQMDGSVAWVVSAPDGCPICECASIVWASAIAEALNLNVAFSDVAERIQGLASDIERIKHA